QPEGGSDVETVTTAPSTAQAQRNREPLYEPNFPLGAFGREEPAAPDAASMDFIHATVWTSGEAGTIEDAVVMVRDGKIAAVMPYSEYQVQSRVQPSETQIDATGMHITPGIID